jgi:hypothetical protein
LMNRVRPVRDRQFYAAWALRHDHCQACGIPASRAAFCRWPGLSRHHVVKFKRSDEGCNLLMLCQRCHDLAELRTVREGGVRLPTLSLAVCLTVKKNREPSEYDHERLRELYGRPLPDLLPVPPVIEAEYRRWRPGAVLQWDRGTTDEFDDKEVVRLPAAAPLAGAGGRPDG